jgi:hypothetical protein
MKMGGVFRTACCGLVEVAMLYNKHCLASFQAGSRPVRHFGRLVHTQLQHIMWCNSGFFSPRGAAAGTLVQPDLGPRIAACRNQLLHYGLITLFAFTYHAPADASTAPPTAVACKLSAILQQYQRIDVVVASCST